MCSLMPKYYCCPFGSLGYLGVSGFVGFLGRVGCADDGVGMDPDAARLLFLAHTGEQGFT